MVVFALKRKRGVGYSVGVLKQTKTLHPDLSLGQCQSGRGVLGSSSHAYHEP
jgi:hypothetical protein